MLEYKLKGNTSETIEAKQTYIRDTHKKRIELDHPFNERHVAQLCKITHTQTLYCNNIIDAKTFD